MRSGRGPVLLPASSLTLAPTLLSRWRPNRLENLWLGRARGGGFADTQKGGCPNLERRLFRKRIVMWGGIISPEWFV